MAQIFHPSTNTISKVSLFGALFFLGGLAWVGGELYRSPYVTREGTPVEQPVPFSHKHHVRDDGIDCRYCHTSVEKSAFAGIPPTKTCMNCHTQIWPDAPMLAPVTGVLRPTSRSSGLALITSHSSYISTTASTFTKVSDAPPVTDP